MLRKKCVMFALKPEKHGNYDCSITAEMYRFLHFLSQDEHHTDFILVEKKKPLQCMLMSKFSN